MSLVDLAERVSSGCSVIRLELGQELDIHEAFQFGSDLGD
jgi:hypothetical protein